MRALSRDNLVNFSFILPALIIFSIFYLYPFINIFFLAFTGNELGSGAKFVGFENFENIFSSRIFGFLGLLLGLVLLIMPFMSAFKKKITKKLKSSWGKKISQVFSLIAGLAISVYFIKYLLALKGDMYAASLDKEWWNSIWHAGYITFWALTFQNFLALVLALCVDRAVKTGKIYRVLFFILPILSEIIIGLFWRTLLTPVKGVAAPYNISPIHHIINMLGLGNLLGNFFSNPLNNPKTALTMVALVHCWKGFGWGFVILLAGLQTIPEDLYEAARIDGANFFQRFFKITLPLLTPVIVLVVILTILGTMQVFALIMALTRGGPAGYTEVPVIRIFNHLTQYKIGYASAEGLVLGLILVAVSFSFMKLSRKIKQS